MLDEKDLNAIQKMMDTQIEQLRKEIVAQGAQLRQERKESEERLRQESDAREARLRKEFEAQGAQLRKESAEREARLHQEIVAQGEEMQRKLQILIENVFQPQFNLLAEGQQAILDKLVSKEDQDLLESRVDTLELVVRKHSREIEQLKKAT